MKKTLCIILSFIVSCFCLYSIAEEAKEITFQGIPWLSDEEIVTENLSNFLEIGYVLTRQPNSSGIILQRNDELIAIPITTRDYADLGSCYALSGTTEAKIAGYAVRELVFTYVRDTSANKLLCVKVNLDNLDYSDLNKKLTKVYGDSKNATNDDGLSTVVWRGANESCVLLYSVDGGETADLFYGRLDAEEFLKAVEVDITTEVDPDDVSGL